MVALISRAVAVGTVVGLVEKMVGERAGARAVVGGAVRTLATAAERARARDVLG